jgi:hypothetical protein
MCAIDVVELPYVVDLADAEEGRNAKRALIRRMDGLCSRLASVIAGFTEPE